MQKYGCPETQREWENMYREKHGHYSEYYIRDVLQNQQLHLVEITGTGLVIAMHRTIVDVLPDDQSDSFIWEPYGEPFIYGRVEDIK